MKKLFYKSALFGALVLFAAGLSACGNGSVASDSTKTSGNQAAAQPAGSPTANQASGAANPVVQPSPQQNSPSANSATPSPTMLPAIKEAQAKPGVPVTVPDSMKRAATAEEMQKMLQQMPPEVRARIQGMQAAPPGVRPQATPTPKK